MKRQTWYVLPLVLFLFVLADLWEPRPLLAGRFEVISVSTPILGGTPHSIEFAVHATAVWQGDQSTSGFNRLFRSFWYVSDEGWCNNSIPGMHCGTIGKVFVPPFSTIHCNSQNGCAANKNVQMSLCSQPSKTYGGRADVVNLHAGTSIDDVRHAPLRLVPCRQLEPRTEPCFAQVQPFALPVLGGAQVAHALPPTSPMRDLRTEIHGSTKFIMDEWAVLAVDAGADGRVTDIEALAASTNRYARFRQTSLTEAIVATRETSHAERLELRGSSARLDGYFRPGRSIVLAVDEPVHPHNERWIEKPVPRLLPGRVDTPGDDAVVVVRADFDLDRSLLSLDVPYAERPLTPSERAFLESHLTLEYASDKSHRAVLFGVLRLGETISLERSRTTMVQCCCEIDPETHECEFPGPI